MKKIHPVGSGRVYVIDGALVSVYSAVEPDDFLDNPIADNFLWSFTLPSMDAAVLFADDLFHGEYTGA